MKRIDTINNRFKVVDKIDKFSKALFWASVLLSLIVFFAENINSISKLCNIIFIIVTIAYFVASNVVSLWLLPSAQEKRRINLLSNSLGVKLDDEDTQLYYNNNEKESVYRLGLNVFESAFHTWKVTEEMVKAERIKILLYLLTFLFLLLIGDIDLNFISIIAQTIFTTGLLVNGLKLELLRSSCKKLHGDFRNLFLANEGQESQKLAALLLKLVLVYETRVANLGVHTSEKVFFKIKPNIDVEWKKVKENLKLS